MRRLPVTEASEQTKAAALAVTQEQRVAVVIVAYDAERHIESVLKRLPGRLAETLTEIAVFDDSSNDATYEMALSAGRRLGLNNLHVLRTPHNLGYGGNQKVAYRRAEQERLDVVVLLHGDGQYAPECLWQMLAPFADPGVDAVLGSRMLNRRDALKGHMPLHKWIGNQVLTGIENMVLGSALSEFHTGYRAYRMRTLGKLPYSYNDAGFHFDTEILIQLMAARARIVEVPIPTWYGDEECHVPGVRYALNCIRSVVRYRLFRFGLLYDPFFDCADEPNYVFKQAPNSLHQYVLAHCVGEEDDVLDLGAASGELGARAALKAKSVVAVDQVQPQRAGRAEALALDLNGAFRDAFHGRRFTRVLMLDVLEHLLHPEEVVESVARLVPPEGVLVASTANIGYLVPRLMLLLGQFNYGKRGILDLTHTRLFTISSFTAMLKARGWSVTAVRGFGPPIRDLISTRWPWSMLDSVLSVLARVWPPLFAYNFLVLAHRRETLAETLEATRVTEAAPIAESA